MTKWKNPINSSPQKQISFNSPLNNINSQKPCHSSSSSSSQLNGHISMLVYDRSCILKELNYLGEWRDSQHSRPYFHFTSTRLGTAIMAFVNILFMFTMIPSSCVAIAQNFEEDRSDDENSNFLFFFSSFALFFLAAFSITLGWRLYLNQVCIHRFKLSEQRRYVTHHWYIAAIHLFVVVAFLRSALSEKSLLADVIDGDHESHVDQGSLITMLVTPILLFSCFLQTRLEVIWILFGCTFLAYLVVVLQMQTYENIPVFIAWFIGGIFIITDLHVRSIAVYMYTNKLQETIAENERMAEQIHANEMRSMIGNVAHDLKTPLSSFTTGVDYIQMVLGDCQSHLKNGENIPKKMLQDSISSIQSCLASVRNTNAFMLMTINRCIDYTKASKGLKLVPRYETIDLKEALDLPLHCMGNIQQRIEIRLNCLPAEICSHIITDKQWLQENVLCLLSNAVKYSSGGCVSITLSLDTKPVLTSTKSQPPPINRVRSNENTPSIRSKISRIIPLNSSSVDAPGQFAHLVSSSMIHMHTHGKQISDVSDVGHAEPDFVSPEVINSKSSDSFHYQETQVMRVEVEDMGIGISDEAMSTLFNPFKQTQRLAGGTGLGLYSLAKRVEALKGNYGLEHRRDGKQGSLFWFSIPYRPDIVTAEAVRSIEKTLLQEVTSPKAETAEVHNFSEMSNKDDSKILRSSLMSVVTVDSDDLKHEQQPGNKDDNTNNSSNNNSSINSNNPNADQSSLDILIVDDSPAILKMTSMMLRKLGHNIDTAENGEVAVKAIEGQWQHDRKTYDLILMDLQMPVMDGLEATRRIRLLEQQFSDKVVSNTITTASRPSLLAAALSNSRIYTSLKKLPSALIRSSSNSNVNAKFSKSETVQEENNNNSDDNNNTEQVDSDNKTEIIDSQKSIKFPRQVIIGLSANSDHETMDEAYRAGVDTFLSKPFNLFTFHDTLQTLNITKRLN